MRFNLRFFLPDEKVEIKYLAAAKTCLGYYLLGDTYTGKDRHLHLGIKDEESKDEFMFYLKKWIKWEKEYSYRGFRTVSFDDFLDKHFFGEGIIHLMGKKRNANEIPIIHAQECKRRLEEGSLDFNPKQTLKRYTDEKNLMLKRNT